MRLLISFLFIVFNLKTYAEDLEIEFSGRNINESGELIYILFNHKEGFPDTPEKGFRRGSVPVQQKNSLILRDLPAGTYAFSVIHDENSNRKLDTNFVGIPKESFGFSNNPKIYFGPPSFERAAFEVKGDSKIHIELKRI